MKAADKAFLILATPAKERRQRKAGAAAGAPQTGA